MHEGVAGKSSAHTAMQNEIDIVRDVSRRLDGAGLAYIEGRTGELGLLKLWREFKP